MAPLEATVIRDGETMTISVDDVMEGDKVIIRSGEKVAIDGRIVSGNATLNEAAITGESVPASKAVDDHVFSGTIVDNGFIEVIAVKSGMIRHSRALSNSLRRRRNPNRKRRNSSTASRIFTHLPLLSYPYSSIYSHEISK